MSNLDFSTMEDWLTAFMVWILALFVLLLCFGIFSLVRKNSFLSEKLVIGGITYKPLQKTQTFSQLMNVFLRGVFL